MSNVKIKGILLEFGDEKLVVPPLALTDLEQLQERLATVTGRADKDSVRTVIDAAHAALKRNYPEMTREHVAGLLDLGNMMEVFQALMDVSGTRRKKQEADAAGEAAGVETQP